MEALERHEQVFKLRIAGHTFAEIARECGYADESAPHHVITREFERRVGRPSDEYRQLQLARLETLWAKQFKKFDASEELDLALIASMRKTIMDMAKLSGLTSPKFQINLLPEDEEPEPDTAPAPKASTADQVTALLDKLRSRAAEQAKPLDVIDHEAKLGTAPNLNDTNGATP